MGNERAVIDVTGGNRVLSETLYNSMMRVTQKNVYTGAAAAIPLYELSRTNEGVRDYIVSEESLRATLCGNYPEYVKTHNMSAPPGERIEDADAPPCLFLQKQLDNEADKTRSEVADFQQARAHESEHGFERLPYEELEL